MATAVPRFVWDRVAAAREEKEDHLSITSAVMPGQGIFIVNPSAKQILNLCDGSNSLSAIHAAFAAGFTEHVPLQQAAADVNEVLKRLDKLGLIEWTTGVNPFRQELDQDSWIGRLGIEYRVTMEHEIDRILQFMEPLVRDGSDRNLLFLPASFSASQYRDVIVRNKVFEYMEAFFTGQLGDTQVALTSVACQPPHSRFQCATLGPVLVADTVDRPEFVALELLDFSCRLANKYMLEPAVKVRASIVATGANRDREVELLSRAEFSHQATLTDELGRGEDCELWDRGLEGS